MKSRMGGPHEEKRGTRLVDSRLWLPSVIGPLPRCKSMLRKGNTRGNSRKNYGGFGYPSQGN